MDMQRLQSTWRIVKDRLVIRAESSPVQKS
jgi:hypothetical protein